MTQYHQRNIWNTSHACGRLLCLPIMVMLPLLQIALFLPNTANQQPSGISASE